MTYHHAYTNYADDPSSTLPGWAAELTEAQRAVLEPVRATPTSCLKMMQLNGSSAAAVYLRARFDRRRRGDCRPPTPGRGIDCRCALQPWLCLLFVPKHRSRVQPRQRFVPWLRQRVPSCDAPQLAAAGSAEGSGRGLRAGQRGLAAGPHSRLACCRARWPSGREKCIVFFCAAGGTFFLQLGFRGGQGQLRPTPTHPNQPWASVVISTHPPRAIVGCRVRVEVGKRFTSPAAAAKEHNPGSRGLSDRVRARAATNPCALESQGEPERARA